MEVKLRKCGNSTVAVLPPGVLKDLGLSAGQAMTLDTTADGRIVLARKHKYSLDELLARCDPKAPVPDDMDAWNAARPVGSELL